MAEPSLAQDWTELAEMDPTVNMMAQHNVPMTAENYTQAFGVGGQGQEQFPEELPAELQSFSGVGLSELPQGPMPLPEGQMGVGPHVPTGQVQLPQMPTQLGKATEAPAVEKPRQGPSSPLEGGIEAPGGQFQVSRGFKGTQPKGQED